MKYWRTSISNGAPHRPVGSRWYGETAMRPIHITCECGTSGSPGQRNCAGCGQTCSGKMGK
jgi:hypothetical protein